MAVRVTFLGAASTVTGSKYLVQSDTHTLLVDCGMFQGSRELRRQNWEVPPVDLATVDAVLLTHAHIDHTGLLPRYYREGLRCPVFCSAATADLTEILLLDSAHLQEEEASYRAEHGRSRHQPPLPLYTTPDAKEALKLLRSVPIGEWQEIAPKVRARWTRMGHIIGACAIELEIGGRRITFSGDVGRYDVPILRDPEPAHFGDLLLIESTYGDREHADHDPAAIMEPIINEAIERKGMVLIPSFAVGRTQLILYYLRELKAAKRIPDIPVIIDSPMASDATAIYRAHPNDYDEDALGILRKGTQPFSAGKMYFTRSREESIKLNSISEPMVLISASGMLTGGRILHHLKQRLPSPLNTLLFVGHQPKGGRGDWLKSGARTLTVLGEEVQVRARVEELSGLSAHADRDELLRWCRSCTGRPSRVAVVHGEPERAGSFAHTLQREFGWNARVPKHREMIELS